MDQPGLDTREHARALAGLRRINRVSRSAAMYWAEICRFAKHRSDGPLRVLDLACGGGDVPIALALRAAAVAPRSTNRRMRQKLRSRADRPRPGRTAGAPVRFFTLDVLEAEIPSGYDIVISSLFLHHLAEPDAVKLLERMARAAARGILINDLVRGPIQYALAWIGCHVLTFSPIVRHDGPVSVRAAFTIPEVRRLASQAGLDHIQLTRHWPGRFLLSWSRP